MKKLTESYLRKVAAKVVSESKDLSKIDGLYEFVNSAGKFTLMSMMIGKTKLTESAKKRLEKLFK